MQSGILTSDGPGRIYPPALFGLLLMVVVCSSRPVLYDGDTFTHIAAGSWMIGHWSVLDRDPFSWTSVGQPWNAHEWLSEVLLAGAYQLVGLTGVLLLTAAAVSLTFANLARHIGTTVAPLGTMVLTTAALICVIPNILARPHLLALPLLELWVAELLRARRDRRAPGAWVLLVMAAWANMHGGFAFGLAMGLALTIEASVQERGARRRVIWAWWALLAGAIGAALLTPQGWNGLMFPFRLLQFQSLALIKEWQPMDFLRNPGFEGVLLALVGALGTGRVRVPWFRMLLLLGLVHLSIAHARHSALFGIAGALILAEPVGRAFAGAGWTGLRPTGQRLCWAGVVATILLRLASPIALEDSPAAPVSALAQLPPGVERQHLLNSSRFGGYLALAGLHPFIDGRVELYGDAFVLGFVAMSAPDGQRLRSGIEQYGIEWAILDVEDPLVTSFDALTGWRRQYADSVAIVFVKGCPDLLSRCCHGSPPPCPLPKTGEGRAGGA